MDICWDDDAGHARIMRFFVKILSLFSLYAPPLICYHVRVLCLSKIATVLKR